MELIVHVDGLSPFKSSPATVWPILTKVHTKDDTYKSFAVAIYAGSAKAKRAFDYLKKFIRELNKLLSSGLIVNNKYFEVKLKFFDGDTPARALIKCIVSHLSFYACERCNVLGKKIDTVTVFSETDATKKQIKDLDISPIQDLTQVYRRLLL